MTTERRTVFGATTTGVAMVREDRTGAVTDAFVLTTASCGTDVGTGTTGSDVRSASTDLPGSEVSFSARATEYPAPPRTTAPERERQGPTQQARAPLRAMHRRDDPEKRRVVRGVRERTVVIRRSRDGVPFLSRALTELAELGDEPRVVLRGPHVGLVEPRLDGAPGRADVEPIHLGGDRVAHRGGVGKPVVRVPRERAIDELAPRLAHHGPLALRGCVHPVEDAPQHLGRVVPEKREVPDHALVEEHAEPEDVGAPVDVPALDLLGRHVGWASEDLPRRRDPLRVEQLGDAEVGELHGHALPGAARGRRVAARRWDRERRRVTRPGARGRVPGAMLDEHVLGLHVAMNDALRVRVDDAGEELEDDRGRDLWRHGSAFLENLPERRTAHQLDDEVLLGVLGRRDVEHLDDVRMPQLRDGLRLDCEAMRDLRVLAKVRVEDLDRDVAAEAPVVRAVHGGHASMTELVEHLVLRQDGRATRFRPGRRNHCAESYPGGCAGAREARQSFDFFGSPMPCRRR